MRHPIMDYDLRFRQLKTKINQYVYENMDIETIYKSFDGFVMWGKETQ